MVIRVFDDCTMMQDRPCVPADVWRVLLQSEAVRSSITAASSIQRLCREMYNAVAVHCRGRLNVCFSPYNLDSVQSFCYWLRAGNWAMLGCLELSFSPLREEAEIERAVELLGMVLQQGARLGLINVRSYRSYDAAGSDSRILRPISCSRCLLSMHLVVGVPHWAGACASVDEYAGAADSGLQVITTAAHQGVQQTASAIRSCKGLRSLSISVVQPDCMAELAPCLSALEQLREVQLSVMTGLHQLRQLPHKRLESLRILSISSSNSSAAASDPALPGSSTSPETTSQSTTLNLSMFSALKQLVCPQGLVIQAGDELPAGLQELQVEGVAAVEPLMPLTQLQHLAADVSQLTSEQLMQLSSSAPKLSSLKLCYSQAACSTSDIGDASSDGSHNTSGHNTIRCSSADRAAAAWPSLPIADVTLCCSVSTATLMQIGHMGSCLQRLSFLAAAPTLNISHLAAALQQLRLLQSFTLHIDDTEVTPDMTESHGTAQAASAGPQAWGDGSSNWGLQLVQSLASLPRLSSLSLLSVPLAAAPAALALAGLQSAASLRYLQLVNCALGDAALASILASATGLRALFIGSSSLGGATSAIGDDLLPAVAALTQLRTLCMTGTKCTAAGEAFLMGLPHLDSVYVGP
jgi:hypothetical protein